MDWSTILSSSLVGATFGAALKSVWDRRAAKKAPKTEMRAEAYRDFIVHVVRVANARPELTANEAAHNEEFHELTARLLLFGESDVVNSAARLLKHKSLNSPEAEDELGVLIQEMRKSLLTGHTGSVIESAKSLAYARPWA